MVDRRLEAQLVISAKDETKSTLANVHKQLDEIGKALKGLSAIERQTKPLSGLGKQFADVERAAAGVNRMASSIARIGREERAISRIAAHLKGLDTLAFGAGAGAFGRFAFKAGATLQDARVEMRMAGIPAAEAAGYERQANELAGKYPRVTSAEILHMTKELRSVLQDVHEVPHMIEPLVKAKAVLDQMDHSGEASSGLGLLVRGGESIGAATDPKRFEKLLDGYVKAMQVMGKTINPEAIYDFDKYIKNSGAQLSDRFLMTSGLSLAQEIGGSTAGNSINMAARYVRNGWKNQHQALGELVRLGLVGKGDVDWNKKMDSARGIKSGHDDFLQGQKLLLSDPDLWTYQYALPAMIKNGITGRDAQLAMFEKLFPKSDAATFFGKILTQRTAFENHAKLYGQAAGLGGVDMLKDSASAGVAGVAGAMQTLVGTAAQPTMDVAAKKLDGMATSISRWTDFVAEHPAAGTAGVFGALGVGGLGATGLWKLATDPISTLGKAGRLGARLGGLGLELGSSAAAMPFLLREIGDAHRPITPLNFPYVLDTQIDAGMWERSRRAQAELHQGADMEAARGRAMGALPFKAEVSGDARVEVHVEVSASPDFLSRVVQQTKTEIMPLVSKAARDAAGGSGIGTTGASSPGMEDRH